MAADYTVREARWPADAAALKQIREEVFVHEQNVPPDLEWDGEDPRCRHVIAEATDGTPIGTGRLMPGGQIGRMAVRKAWRGTGVGGALLLALVEQARQAALPECHLHAQVNAIPFYERHGFTAEGEVFMDANIPHRNMWLKLS